MPEIISYDELQRAVQVVYDPQSPEYDQQCELHSTTPIWLAAVFVVLLAFYEIPIRTFEAVSNFNDFTKKTEIYKLFQNFLGNQPEDK